MQKSIPKNIDLTDIDIWFQDEARFGQQNTITRIWAKTGTRPRSVRQGQFKSTYLFGAVCITNGKTEAFIAPCGNLNVMSQHLSQISMATAKKRHAVVIIDCAGYHQERLADKFENLSIVKLPPYSPELNPIEQVWSWLRQHDLANRCFKDYEDIVSKVSIAWNRFIESTNSVLQLCRRKWANVNS